MNSTSKRCSVENCEGYKRFLFPKSMELRKKWLEAIRKPNLVVKSSYGLCDKHFDPADMLTESVTGGYSMKKVRLKTNSVPCIFPWDLKDGEKSNVLMVNDKVPLQDVDGCDLETIQNMDIDSDCNLDDQPQSVLKLPASVSQLGFEVYEQTCIATALELENKDRLTSANEIKCGSTSDSPTDNKDSYKKKSTVSIQTQGFPRYNIDDFKHKPQALNHFTGLNYTKFMTVLHTLGPVMIHFEKIEKTKKITIPNQLFLVLWKLRRSTCNLELAEHFNVSVVSVSDIFNVWISVMSKTWSLIDIWPSRELVDFYMPHVFRNNYPKARVTLDATEIKIDAPSNPKLKQSTFSTYKNCNTLKVMVGTSPGGLISHISTPYGGSTSDRQIIERSDLREKCQTGDVILADKGIMVQDLFAPCNVTVSTPTPLVSGSLPHKTVMKDRKLSKHRVHVERVIGLMKTYTILSKKLTRDLLPLASEIIQVCVMLTNFKDNIM